MVTMVTRRRVALVRSVAVSFASASPVPAAPRSPVARRGVRAGAPRPSPRTQVMFEQLRASFRAMLDAARSPDDRRAVLGDMKESVVRARMGVDDLRRGVEEVRRRLEAGRSELDTLVRRRDLAAGIGDQETVQVAERFAGLQRERVAVLEQKLAAQEAELALVEREVAEMTTDLRRATDGVPLRPPGPGAAGARAVDVDPLDPDAGLRAELDALGRRQASTARETDVDARLAELKRRLGR